jgi:hypothetical protein
LCYRSIATGECSLKAKEPARRVRIVLLLDGAIVAVLLVNAPCFPTTFFLFAKIVTSTSGCLHHNDDYCKRL